MGCGSSSEGQNLVESTRPLNTVSPQPQPAQDKPEVPTSQDTNHVSGPNEKEELLDPSPLSHQTSNMSGSDKSSLLTMRSLSPPHISEPPVVPPVRRKHEVFLLQDHLIRDYKAINTPKNYMYSHLEDLVTYLTHDTDSNMAKLRSLFTWLTSIDVPSLQHIMTRLPDPHTPLDYLLKLHWRLTNYAHLFAQLCWLAHIPCYIIDGINKSAAYEVGDIIDPNRLAAQWNAVFVDDEWRLLDVFWASTCVVGRKSKDWELLDENDDSEDTFSQQEEEDGRTQHIVNEFFFLPDPDNFCWTHYPNDPKWQLLSNPITLEEFQNRVYIRERYFDLGMIMLEDYKNCMLTAIDGEISFLYKIPQGPSSQYQFRYLLYKQRLSSEDQTFGNLDNYVFYMKSADTVSYKARFPVAGRFRMDIYGRDISRHEKLDLVCSYVILCATPKAECAPLPAVPEIGWGPGSEAEKAGLQATTHDNGNIYTDDGKVQIRFNMTNALSVLQNLRNNNLDEWLLRRHAVVSIEGEEMIVDLRLPSGGEYALNLFADEKNHEGELPNVCNYLITCTSDSGAIKPFPKLHEGILGPGHAAEILGIKTPDALQGKFSVDEDSKTLTFQHPTDIELFCELYHTDNDRYTMSDRVTRTANNGTTTFAIDLNGGGMFGVNIYAKQKGQNTSRLYHIHTYLIDNLPDGTTTDDSFADDGLDIEVYEMITSKDNITVNIPKRSNEPLHLLADLRRCRAQEKPNDEQLHAAAGPQGYLFNVALPEFGEYTLDVYQALDSGALIHKAAYVIHREETVEEEPLEVAPPVLLDPEEEARRQEAKAKEEKVNSLRQQLKDAMKMKDERTLMQLIKALEELGDSPEALRDLDRAKDQLAYWRLSQALQMAMAARDLKQLETLVREAEGMGMGARLGLQLEMARRIVQQLHRIEQLRHDIMNLDQKTIAELKSYSKPPKPVHVVMTATFVLLGESEQNLKEWQTVQVLIGKTGKKGLKRRVSEFKPSTLPIHVVHTAKRLLSHYNVNDVRDVSAGAATFYVWSKGNIEEAESLNEQRTINAVR